MNAKSQTTAEIREFILFRIEQHPHDVTAATAARFGISPQAVRKHIQALLDAGLVLASGATRSRTYRLADLVNFSKEISISPELSEDRIWRQDIRPLMDGLPPNVLTICQYGFTEMVNNVLEHAECSSFQVRLRRSAASVEITIHDNGVGIFRKVQRAFNLEDPLHAILELSKGKLTTSPANHTGEGIFFTSRVFDRFLLASGHLTFTHTTENDDWLQEETGQDVAGTLVQLTISAASPRSIQEVFDRFANPEDYNFSRTQVPVHLARYGDENLVSRSQARRLLARFERFRHIILDFQSVEMIGQAFADEIFRVFTQAHPGIQITHINAVPQVAKMISRAASRDES